LAVSKSAACISLNRLLIEKAPVSSPAFCKKFLLLSIIDLLKIES